MIIRKEIKEEELEMLEDIPPGRDGRFYKLKKCSKCHRRLKREDQMNCTYCGNVVNKYYGGME